MKRKTTRQVRDVPCPTCQARMGAPCMDAHGRAFTSAIVHQERRKRADNG